MNFQKLFEELEDSGLLLLSDKSLPSVVALVAGERVKGSWWNHPKGGEIFGLLKQLMSHPDVLGTRLVSGKVTYLHLRLWPDFLSIATAKKRWQTDGLSYAALDLLSSVEDEGQLRMDDYFRQHRSKSNRESAHELEMRLLVYSEEIHTRNGTHSKLLTTWSNCPKVGKNQPQGQRPSDAMESFQVLLDRLNASYSGSGELPWRQQYSGAHRAKRST